MSHREKGLTPWITEHGIEKVVLPQKVYDAAVAEGCDMRYFVRQEMIPTKSEYHDYDVLGGEIRRVTEKIATENIFVIEHPQMTGAQRRGMIDAAIRAGLPLGASHGPEVLPGVYAFGSITSMPEYSKIAPSDKPRWPCRGYAPVRDDAVTDKPAVEPVINTNSNVGGDRTAETVRGLRNLLGDDMRPVSEMLRGPPKPRRPRLFKKHRDSVSCHDCMPGLGGRCTCCAERE